MSDRLSRSEPQSRPGNISGAEKHTSLPVASLPGTLSKELRDISPDQSLFVDSAGALHRDKRKILDEEIPPLVSFRKEHDGSFRVYAGLPPRNKTHCGTGTAPSVDAVDAFHQLPDMHGPVVLNSGDWIALAASLSLSIPTFKQSDLSRATVSEKLSHRIASAEVGQTIVLGRGAEPTCPAVVSRAHISIKVLERIDLSPTKVQMRVVALPGIAGSQPIFEVKQDGSLEQIVGSKKVAAGGTIQIGIKGERFTLPHPANSLEADSILYHHSILRGDPAADQSVLSVHGVEGLKKAQFLAFKDFVLKGVELIRIGQPKEAIKHLLSDSKELAAAGYSVEVNNQISLKALTPEEVARNLNTVARRSSFQCLQRLIYPSIAMIDETKLSPSNQEERDLLEVWGKNAALIVAEEFVHALQDMNGGAISDYTPLVGHRQEVNSEADVALFFKRHGIDLSDGHFVKRYPVRASALRLVEGTQTPQEALKFEESVLSAALGSPVPVHDGALIARSQNGYIVTPTQSGVSCFVLRSTGTARPLRDTQTLQGGDELFIGERRFTLPRFSSGALDIEKV